jgi:phage FluMu protein Com
MSNICKILRDTLNKRGTNVNSSDSANKVLQFEKSPYSTALYDFLKRHKVNRIVFNSLVKQGIINPSSLKEVKELLMSSELSLVYLVACKSCNNLLERVHILNADFSKKQSSCPSCTSINHIYPKDYKPDYENLTSEDLWRCLLELCQNKLYSQVVYSRCLNCKPKSNQSTDKNVCAKCGKVCLITTELVTLDKQLDELVKSRQGYWLEWYVWRLLRSKFKNGEPGIILKSQGKEGQLDVVVCFKNKIIAIECKDGLNTDFIQKLHWIKKYIDGFILIATEKMKDDVIKTAKQIMGRKFKYIQPKDIESVGKVIKQL